MSDEALRYKNAVRSKLRSVPGFAGVGIGMEAGMECLRIYLESAESEAARVVRRDYPNLIAGDHTPIILEVTGSLSLQ